MRKFRRMGRRGGNSINILAFMGGIFCTILLAKFALKLLLWLVMFIFHLASIVFPIVFILLIFWWVFKL